MNNGLSIFFVFHFIVLMFGALLAHRFQQPESSNMREKIMASNDELQAGIEKRNNIPFA